MHSDVRSWLLVAALSSLLVAAVEAVDLDRMLDVLPRVDRFQIDDLGRLVSLEGELTPPGSSPPSRAAVAFVTVHRGLLPAARGSAFHAEQVVYSGGRATVVVRQRIDGFRVLAEQLRLEFSDRGVLVRLEGVVLRGSDLAPAEGEAMNRGRAVEVARDAVAGTDGFEVVGARKVVVGGRRCWQVELYRRESERVYAVLVTLDAFSGAILDLTSHQLPEDDWGVGGGTRQPGETSIGGCEPWTPSVGDFGSADGQQLWSAAIAGCGRWEFDRELGASLLHGNCLEYVCDPYPATDSCNHGEISRTDIELEPGYERVRLEVLTPDRELFMRLRWGPSVFEAAPFLVPTGPDVATIVELDLADFRSWNSGAATGLTLELVDDHFIWLRTLDLLPGPWLELARGPSLEPAVAGEPLVAGEPVTVMQDVRNLGCRLDSGTHAAMRSVSYRLYERVGFTWRYEGLACDGAEIPGAIPPESAVRGLPMCSFDLPDAGTWRIEGRFDVHPSPPVASVFQVQPATAPNLAVDLSQPVDLYSGRLFLWPARSDFLDRSRYGSPNPPPYVIAVATRASGVVEPVTTTIAAWARPRAPMADPSVCDPDSGGWYPLGDPVTRIFSSGAGGPVELLIDPARVLSLPIGSDGWSIVDLKIAIEPVADELDTSDNRACIAAWLPVADADLGSAMGPTWVDDSYFLDPQHWPPDGLVWTGVTLEHHEGSAWMDPDSALVAMTVDDGANEAPRVVWFEGIDGETVSGLLLRYRRAEVGYGGPAFLDGGSAEAFSIPDFDLEVPGHPNRSLLTPDTQWRTLVWRRGDSGPFGPFPVPQLVSPGGAGPLLSLHLAPDRNCLVDEPTCPSGLRPETMLDVVGVWHDSGTPPLEPLFTVAGLRARQGDDWGLPPATVTSGEVVVYGVEIRNVGTAMGVAELSAEVEILPIDEAFNHLLVGAETVPIPAGGFHVLALDPPWRPIAPGQYLISGAVRESGAVIGQVEDGVEVVGGGTQCPVPTVNLP